jgi:hypothetical protein
MGWKSDWLYGLVFQQVAAVWNDCMRTGKGRYGPPPERFLVTECSTANWDMPFCTPPIVRAWHYNDSGVLSQPLPNPEALFPATAPAHPDSMFFATGDMRFHITPERTLIVFSYLVGPRYGRGRVYRVIGQGTRGTVKGRLDPAEGYNEWVA